MFTISGDFTVKLLGKVPVGVKVTETSFTAVWSNALRPNPRSSDLHVLTVTSNPICDESLLNRLYVEYPRLCSSYSTFEPFYILLSLQSRANKKKDRRYEAHFLYFQPPPINSNTLPSPIIIRITDPIGRNCIKPNNVIDSIDAAVQFETVFNTASEKVGLLTDWDLYKVIAQGVSTDRYQPTAIPAKVCQTNQVCEPDGVESFPSLSSIGFDICADEPSFVRGKSKCVTTTQPPDGKCPSGADPIWSPALGKYICGPLDTPPLDSDCYRLWFRYRYSQANLYKLYLDSDTFPDFCGTRSVCDDPNYDGPCVLEKDYPDGDWNLVGPINFFSVPNLQFETNTDFVSPLPNTSFDCNDESGRTLDDLLGGYITSTTATAGGYFAGGFGYAAGCYGSLCEELNYRTEYRITDCFGEILWESEIGPPPNPPSDPPEEWDEAWDCSADLVATITIEWLPKIANGLETEVFNITVATFSYFCEDNPVVNWALDKINGRINFYLNRAINAALIGFFPINGLLLAGLFDVHVDFTIVVNQ